MAVQIQIGTSGYSYSEWTAAGFYPPNVKQGHMLPLYARRYSVTELNYTWYQLPKAEAIARMLDQAPESFCFAAKLTRTLTHDISAATWPDQATRYRDGIAPLCQAKRLIAVLVQLPPSFRYQVNCRRYLAQLLDVLEGLPLAVEFRHVSWAQDRVFAELEQRRITLVSVDAPPLPGLFPSLDVVTNPDLIYVRFHGRNAAGWRSGRMQAQFDYDYTDDELGQWAQTYLWPMTKKARAGVVFFNNHVRAQAPKNADQLAHIIAADMPA